MECIYLRGHIDRFCILLQFTRSEWIILECDSGMHKAGLIQEPIKGQFYVIPGL